ncbi:Ribosome production factor 1 [Halotydeus destructor]|nr:Ribosome production factor 1 [Halotydeus destructor]
MARKLSKKFNKPKKKAKVIVEYDSDVDSETMEQNETVGSDSEAGVNGGITCDFGSSDDGGSGLDEPSSNDEEDDNVGNDEDEEVEDAAKGGKVKAAPAIGFPQESLLSNIKNKLRRIEEHRKMRLVKNKAKREARDERQKQYKLLGDKAPPKQVPRTIENTREPDVTMVDPEDEEVKEDEAADEFATYFRKEKAPKILITSSDNPHSKTIKFCRELKQTIPNAEFRFRNRSSIKKMLKAASALNYTDVIIVNEDRRNPNGMLICHLPHGPTAYFKMSTVRYCKQIKRRAKLNSMKPEVIINNFNTRLGHTVGRMFASLLHFDPEFQGRRVVTFHNQRDYIFFRHHRYEFKNGQKVSIQEIGPRFTLKLRWVQNGTFDTKQGEFEWTLKRHEMATSRLRFFL